MHTPDIRKRGLPYQRLLFAAAVAGLVAWTIVLAMTERNGPRNRGEREEPVAGNAAPPPEPAKKEQAEPAVPIRVEGVPADVKVRLEREMRLGMGQLQAALKAQREKVLQEMANMPALTIRNRGPKDGKPRIGLGFGPPTPLVAAQLRLPPGQALVVTQVVPGGAAQRAGLNVHDVLLEMDGAPVRRDARHFKNYLEEKKPGAVVKLVTLRGGMEEKRELTVP